MKLLIAESDHTLAKVYTLFFEEEGYQVDVATDAWQCRLALRENAPELVIIEYELPWGGALAVLNQLRHSPWEAPCPIILNSCTEIPQTLLMDPRNHIVGHLLKPFRLKRLATLVHRAANPPRGAIAFASDHEEAENSARVRTLNSYFPSVGA